MHVLTSSELIKLYLGFVVAFSGICVAHKCQSSRCKRMAEWKTQFKAEWWYPQEWRPPGVIVWRSPPERHPIDRWHPVKPVTEAWMYPLFIEYDHPFSVTSKPEYQPPFS